MSKDTKRRNSHRGHRERSADSGFALGRNQKVRLTEKLRKELHINRLRSAKTKIEHKKQRFERLYYREKNMWEFPKRILKSAIENWLVSLLTAVGVAIGGWLLWLYRSYLKDWLLSIRYVEMPGWMWVASVLTVGALPVFIILLCKKMRRRISYRNDEEITVVLGHKLRKYDNQKHTEILIDFRECDRKWRFPKGSAQRLLPSVVQKDKTWKIKSKSGNAMTITRNNPQIAVIERGLRVNQ